MTLIDRHVFFAFIRSLGWSMLAFISIFLLVDLFDHLDDFLDDNATTFSIARYYFYQLPMIIDLVFPVSVLLASLFTMGVLSKNNEYAAILSAGLSLPRVGRSILIFGLFASVVALVFRETVVPEANARQTDVFKYEIEGRAREDLKSKRNFSYIGEAGRVYVVKYFRARPPTLEGVSVQTFNDSTMVQRIDAEKAVWQEDHWVFTNGAIRQFRDDGEHVQSFVQRELEPPVDVPKDFSRRQVEPDEMSYKELRRFSGWVRRSGGDPTPYLAALAHKVSFPLVNLIFVLLGLALGAGRQRTTLWAGFGLTVGLAFVYYLLMNFGLQLGKNGAIPIWVSAWSGNMLYGTAALVMFARAGR